jgi:23S rRNA (cytidine1920-2'-O)/16S rRNA (cytidine1409-2'-O)-methyltransferase
MLAFCRENGYAISGLSYSPVKGPKGNIEFLLYLAQEDAEVDAMTIVEQAHRELDGEKE